MIFKKQIQAGALFGVMAVTGCSKLELTLKWADTFVLSEVGDYFDLSSMQKEEARKEFKDALQQAKKNDFVPVSRKLDEFAKLIETSKATPENVEQFVTSLEPMLKKMLSRFEPLAQKIVQEQSQKGFSRFDETFQKKYSKDLREVGEASKLKKETQKKLDFWLKETVETLTPDQEKYLSEQMQKNPLPLALQLANRKYVYEQFKEARGVPAKRKEFMHRLLTDWESIQTPEYAAVRGNYQKKSISWMLEIFKTLSNSQKQRMIEHLKKRSAEFQKLSE